MKNILSISSHGFTRPLAVAFAGLVLIGSNPVHANQGDRGHGAHADAVDNTSMHTSKEPGAMRGHQRVGDYDGDGKTDLNVADSPAAQSKFKAGKALADTVKHSDQPSNAARAGGGRNPQTGKEIKGVGAKRAGDPVPDIDITVPQSPGGGK